MDYNNQSSQRIIRVAKTAAHALAFAIAGGIFSIAGFLSAIADTGYASPSSRTLFFGILALWPSLLCGWALVAVRAFDSLRDFGAASPMLYTFGIPIAGWASVGAFVGWLRSRKAGSPPEAKSTTWIPPWVRIR